MRMFSLLTLAFAACVSAQGRPVEAPAEGAPPRAEARERVRAREATPAKPDAAPRIVERRVVEVAPKQGEAVIEVEGMELPRAAIRWRAQDPAPKPGSDRADLERRLQELNGRLDRLQRILETKLQAQQPPPMAQPPGDRGPAPRRAQPQAEQGQQGTSKQPKQKAGRTKHSRTEVVMPPLPQMPESGRRTIVRTLPGPDAGGQRELRLEIQGDEPMLRDRMRGMLRMRMQQMRDAQNQGPNRGSAGPDRARMRQMMLERMQQRMPSGPAPEQRRGPQGSGMRTGPQWYRAPMPGTAPHRGEFQPQGRPQQGAPEGMPMGRPGRGPGRAPEGGDPRRSGRRDV